MSILVWERLHGRLVADPPRVEAMKGRMRQVAVICAWLAAGCLLAGLIVLQAERIVEGDRALWIRS